MPSGISYRIAVLADRSELAELLVKHFYPNEPFNCGWVNDDPVPEDIVFTLDTLSQGTSFIALDGANNTIVGACITGVDEPSSTQAMLDEANRTQNKKWAQYLRLYARIDSDANIYERFNVQKTFHVHCLAVNGDYRGRSIATKLVAESFATAASLGHKICSINCSSVYTERIAVKLKMECISELDMADIKGEDNERLVYPTPPHTSIRSYAKRLWRWLIVCKFTQPKDKCSLIRYVYLQLRHEEIFFHTQPDTVNISALIPFTVAFFLTQINTTSM